MARRVLGTGASYDPFSFSEMSAPLEMYKKEYEERQNAFHSLEEEANALRNKLNETDDPEEYKKIKNFYDDIMRNSERISKYGLDMSTKIAVDRLKTSFNKDIKPMIDSYKEYEEELKYRDEINNKYQDVVWDDDLSGINFSGFKEKQSKGPISRRYYNGEDLLKNLSIDFAPLSEIENETKYRSVLGGQQYEVTKSSGMSDKDINDAINGINNGRNGQLLAICERQKQVAGFDEMSDARKAQFLRQQRTATWASKGKSTTSYIDNKEYMTAAQRANLAARLASSKSSSSSTKNDDLTDAQKIKGYYKDEDGNIKYDPERDLENKRTLDLETNKKRIKESDVEELSASSNSFKTKTDVLNLIRQNPSYVDEKGILNDAGKELLLRYTRVRRNNGDKEMVQAGDSDLNWIVNSLYNPDEGRDLNKEGEYWFTRDNTDIHKMIGNPRYVNIGYHPFNWDDESKGFPLGASYISYDYQGLAKELGLADGQLILDDIK